MNSKNTKKYFEIVNKKRNNQQISEGIKTFSLALLVTAVGIYTIYLFVSSVIP